LALAYLVDANVLSEVTRTLPSQKVVAWLQVHESEIAVDPIVLGEMRAGILAMPRGRKRAQLEQWFQTLAASITCLPWDAPTGLRWAELLVALKKRGRAMPLLDGMIAATALKHDLTIATRNVRDFDKAGVSVLNPFE
jgi:predicted nucleic acid-binding protein